MSNKSWLPNITAGAKLYFRLYFAVFFLVWCANTNGAGASGAPLVLADTETITDWNRNYYRLEQKLLQTGTETITVIDVENSCTNFEIIF